MSILHKLRSRFLSPNSPLELWLRTLYHRLSATRLFFYYQDWRAKRSYRKWLGKIETEEKVSVDALKGQPTLSFLLDYSNKIPKKLFSTIQSIQNLDYDQWEIIIITQEKKKTSELLNVINNQNIVLITPDNTSLLHATNGAYLLFCSAGDRFHPHLLSSFYNSLSEHPSSELFYFDCDYLLSKSSQHQPFFKPSTISPELLLSVNYLSRSFIRKDVVSEYFFVISSEEDLLSLEYGLIFRLVENCHSIQHIPKILISQSSLVEADHPSYQEIINSHLDRVGLSEPAVKLDNAMPRFSWQSSSPSISIIIPTRNHAQLLKTLIPSIQQNTDDPNLTINLVDNDSDDEDTLSYYEDLKKNPNISIIPYHGEFNYSQAINLGARNTKSDLLLFLNDDMEVIDSHWLYELARWAMRPNIGVVGAKLIRENQTIQHAGIILGLSGFAGHIYLNAPEHYRGLFGSVDWYRNYLAVTGACQMVRREVFDEVGGYDEGFQIAFGDIDFCLRIHDLGYRNVYTPFARLYHYEGKSRGYSTPIEDIKRAYNKHADHIEKHDPYFSPNLTYTRIPKITTRRTSEENRRQQIEERKKFYFSSKDE